MLQKKNLRFLEQQKDLIIKPNIFRLLGSINKMQDIQTFLAIATEVCQVALFWVLSVRLGEEQFPV